MRSVHLALSVCLLAGTAAAQLPLDLVDSTADVGITHQYFDFSPVWQNDTYGISAADYNNDGLIDLYIGDAKHFPSQLYKNMGDGTFLDVAVAAGVGDPLTTSSQGLFLDYDNDGDLDLFVFGHMGQPLLPLGPAFKLFRNGGASTGYTFTDVSDDAGFAPGAMAKPIDHGWVGGTAAADYDKDGFVDIYVAVNEAPEIDDLWRLLHSEPNPIPGDPNDPTYTPRVFVDATFDAGLDPAVFLGKMWQAVFCDVNRDGYPDLHQNVDFQNDILWMNNQDGTFTDEASAVGMNGDPEETRNEMGAGLGDFDLDLDLDWHLTNVGDKDRFYRNDSAGENVAFVDIATQTGLNNSVFGWGSVFFDMDNDGDEDHASVTGFEHVPQPYTNQLHENLYPRTYGDTGDIAWRDVSDFVPDYHQEMFGDDSRCLTKLDFDNDGDIDLVSGRNLLPTIFYENTLDSDNEWLEVDLVGQGGSLNTTGSRVFLRAKGRTQYRERISGSSFLAQNSPRLHFGLGPVQGAPLSGSKAKAGGAPPLAPAGGPAGPATGIGGDSLGGGSSEWLIVYWPDDVYQLVKNPGVNEIITVTHDGGNDAGDMDGDGSLTPKDFTMLELLFANRTRYERLYPDSPGLVLGDVDGNGVINSRDLLDWPTLLP